MINKKFFINKMQVSTFNNNDSLSESYEAIISILVLPKPTKKDLFDLEDILKRVLSKNVESSLTSCVGGNLNSNMANLIFEFYLKFKIDIPIINSLICVHNILGVYYKEILELALYDNPKKSFEEKIELNKTIFEQFPSNHFVNLTVYLKLLSVTENIMVCIYDFKKQEYITDTLYNLLNRDEYACKKIEWIDNKSVYFS